MIYTVLLKEEASADVSDAYSWYESRQENLGEHFLDELEEYINILERDPQIYQMRRENRRYCPMKRFPYLLVYEIEGTEVIVYAVFNTYQHHSRLENR